MILREKKKREEDLFEVRVGGWRDVEELETTFLRSRGIDWSWIVDASRWQGDAKQSLRETRLS
jgi:hypothetical protein